MKIYSFLENKSVSNQFRTSKSKEDAVCFSLLGSFSWLVYLSEQRAVIESKPMVISRNTWVSLFRNLMKIQLILVLIVLSFLHEWLEICPIHRCLLKPRFFTDQLSKVSARNPRLVYDLRGNGLLVQRMYVCNYNGMSHRYLSASETIFQSVPRLYSDNCFPFVMFYKLACTKELLDLLETQILQWVSFLKVS